MPLISATTMATKPENPHGDVIQHALQDPAVSRIYANGFTIGMSNADAHVVLQYFGRPVAIVSMSYTLAKTLHEKLGGLVVQWEKSTGQTLQTTDSIELNFGKERK